MSKTVRLKNTDVNTLRREIENVGKRWSGSKRFKIEIGERYNINGDFPDRSINIWNISNDPSGDWNDTDLYTTLDWEEIRKPILLTVDGRAIIDFYVYEWDDAWKCFGDLVTNAQAEFDEFGLKAVHEDNTKNRWTRP